MAGKCVHCGRCLAVCPVYKVGRDEKETARGRLALIQARQEGRLGEDATYKRALSACLLCGSCERACANEVEVRKEVLRARAGLVGGLKRLALKATASPRRLDRLSRAGQGLQKIFQADPESGLRIRYPAGRLDLPALAERSLASLYPEPVGPLDGPRLLFFPGCMSNYVLVGAGRAAVELLTGAGFRLFLPPEAGCCGLPAQAAGMTSLAEKRIKETAKVLKEAAAAFGEAGSPIEGIAVICATGGRRLREELPRLWPQAPPLLELSQALARIGGQAGPKLPAPPSRTPKKVTFHDPCHSLDPGSGLPEAAREVISRLEGFEFVESNAEPTCCGSGGLFGLSHADLSQAIGQAKAVRIAESGAEIVATTCPACLLRLKEVCAPLGVEAVHLSELIARSRLTPAAPAPDGRSGARPTHEGGEA